MKLTYIKDVLNNNYVGIDLNQNVVAPYLNELEEYIDNEKLYKTLIANQQLRDHNTWHITVINVFEYNALVSSIGMKNFLERLDNLFVMEVEDVIFKGIGKAERNGNIAYFIVCESDFLTSVRDSFGLPNQDFHCTLGFNRKDVHGVRKNVVIDKKPKLIKKVAELYYKNNKSFNFINEIKNLNTTLDKIEVVSITDTCLTIQSNNTFYGIGLVDNGDGDILYVVSEYPCEEDKYINQYQIEKILGQA